MRNKRTIRSIRKVLSLLLLLGLLAPGGGGNGSAQAPSKLGGALQRIIGQRKLGFSAAQAYAQTQGVEIRQTAGGQERLTVVVESARNVEALIQSEGGVVGAKYKDLWLTDVPLDNVERLADTSTVSFIRLPQVAKLADPLSSLLNHRVVSPPVLPAQAGPIVSGGTTLIGALELHAQGITGRGVKVGIIDLGFARVDQVIQRGELPEGVVAWDCLAATLPAGDKHRCRKVSPAKLSADSGGEVHGAAVAEIVHDVAPDAELWLFLVSNEVELGQAFVRSLDGGVRVINHSVAWFNQDFYRGRGRAGQIVRDAVQNGIFWVNAAGNSAQTHYEGPFQDKDGDGYHDQDLTVELEEGQTLTALLTWDAWPKTTEDFDLFLERGPKTEASSTNAQNGTEPKERLVFGVQEAGTYRLRIKWVGAGPPPVGRRLELFIEPPTLTLQPDVPASSLPAPVNAVEVFAAGAVGVQSWPEGKLEPFSSWGPTNDGRSKPDLVAPDCVRTVSYESAPSAPFCGENGEFPGTSAAAPHVAGAAALLLSQTPDLDPETLAQQLVEQSQPIPGAPPNQVGAGKLHLGLLKGPDLAIEEAQRASGEPLESGQSVELTVTVKNQGEMDTDPFWLAAWLEGEVGRAGLELGSRRVSPGLAAGEERQVQLRWKLSEQTAARSQNGALKLVLVADAFDDVVEKDEDNNRFELSLPLKRAGPTVEPSALSFQGQEGGEAPPAQALTLANPSPSQLRWTAQADQGWIALSQKQGVLAPDAQAQLVVLVKLAGLSVGTHRGEITIATEQDPDRPLRVAVTLTVTPRPAALAVEPTELSFQAPPGGPNPDEQALTVRNAGGQPLGWTATADQSWLGLSLSRGTLAAGEGATVQVSVDVGGLSPGTYRAEIELAAPEAPNSPLRVPVTLEVFNPQGKIEIGPSRLSFSASVGHSPGPQTLTLSNSGGQAFEWKTTTTADWILLGVSGGTLEAGQTIQISVFISAQDLPAGTHRTTITFVAPGALGSPVQVEITLTLSSS